jgi:RNA polymerase sigma-70 factor, ECF subfamily
MGPDESFVEIMAALRSGEDSAAVVVFQRFARKLILLARRQIDSSISHKIDPEDVVQSAYRSFFLRYQAGQFDIGTWNDLWGLLTIITLRKCHNRTGYFQAQCRDTQREISWPPRTEHSGPPWEAIDRAPTPLEAAVLAETVQEVLSRVDPCERPIIELSLQGYTVQEISTQLPRAERTVRRVRERLKKHLQRLQQEDVHEP